MIDTTAAVSDVVPEAQARLGLPARTGRKVGHRLSDSGTPLVGRGRSQDVRRRRRRLAAAAAAAAAAVAAGGGRSGRVPHSGPARAQSRVCGRTARGWWLGLGHVFGWVVGDRGSWWGGLIAASAGATLTCTHRTCRQPWTFFMSVTRRSHTRTHSQ